MPDAFDCFPRVKCECELGRNRTGCGLGASGVPGGSLSFANREFSCGPCGNGEADGDEEGRQWGHRRKEGEMSVLTDAQTGRQTRRAGDTPGSRKGCHEASVEGHSLNPAAVDGRGSRQAPVRMGQCPAPLTASGGSRPVPLPGSYKVGTEFGPPHTGGMELPYLVLFWGHKAHCRASTPQHHLPS